ncbi:lipoprotein [Peptoniphilus obesi]|uniref:LptM family lipoprotein n=1 Tax=Peptoniphilus obesi TaxID=1472765 RepID=UPI0004BC4746|nr:hypothetical protein [Peptoniphilus obesi]
MSKHLSMILIMSASLMLSSCGKKDDSSNNKQTQSNNTSINLTNKNSNSESDLLEEDAINSSKSPSKETLRNLVENSDYISRVRVQMDPANKPNYTFIEDYKGDLSSVVIALPDNLLANREYLIFYLDGTNGKIMPTREDQSFVEIQSTNDASLKYIESIFKKDSTPSLKDDKSTFLDEDDSFTSDTKLDDSKKKSTVKSSNSTTKSTTKKSDSSASDKTNSKSTTKSTKKSTSKTTTNNNK